MDIVAQISSGHCLHLTLLCLLQKCLKYAVSILPLHITFMHWLKTCVWGLEHPFQPISEKTPLPVLPKTHVVIAPSHTYLADPPVLLKTPPAKVVDAKATVEPDAGVVGPLNNKTELARRSRGCHQRWQGRGQEDEKADTVDAGDDHDLQCHEVGVTEMASYVPSHAERLTTDQSMGHAHAQLGTIRTKVESDTDSA